MKQIIILACSKRKIWDKDNSKKKVEAKNAYLGSVFLYGKKYAEKNKLPYLIISAKYGLLNPNRFIEKYDKKLSNKRDVLQIKNKFRNQIKELFNKYNKILLIGGNQYYRLVFKGFNDKKFDCLKTKNLGCLLKKVKKMAEQ